MATGMSESLKRKILSTHRVESSSQAGEGKTLMVPQEILHKVLPAYIPPRTPKFEASLKCTLIDAKRY